MSRGSDFFSVMVVGDNPTELMSKYEIGIEVEPYVKYKYKDAEKMRNNAIKLLNGIIKDQEKLGLNPLHIDSLKERLRELKSLTRFEYYKNLVEGYYIDSDGNAISSENPNGKWQTSKIGNNFSLPLILKDGTTSKQALCKDIDWDAMHMVNTITYETVWDLVVEGKEAVTEQEKVLFENMKNQKKYFSRFKNKDEYVIHNCAYWNYAFLSEEGWIDLDDAKSDMVWISEFFDKFITNLNPNDKVTIFECTRGKID